MFNILYFIRQWRPYRWTMSYRSYLYVACI